MPDWASARESLESTLVNAVWRQWSALDSPAGERRPARAIVDPEALILASTRLVERERRLWDLLAWWARTSSRLLSVQRMKNLASGPVGDGEPRVGEFAHLALETGNDGRWKSFERTPPSLEARASKTEAPPPRLRHPATLILLLRRGMGVGIKPDVLGVLVGEDGRGRDVKSLARATMYSSRAVRRSAEEMAQGRLIRIVEESPITFSADASAWLAVLRLEPPPPEWRPWHQVFSLFNRLTRILGGLEAGEEGYVASSRLRDAMTTYAGTLRTMGLEVPEAERYKGEEYLEPFLEFVPHLTEWLEDAV